MRLTLDINYLFDDGPKVIRFRHAPTRTVGELHDYGTHAELAMLRTPQAYKGQGGAHHVMQQITSHLDQNRQQARLHAEPFSGTDPHRLTKFYSRYGFRPAGEPGDMIRRPH